MARPPHPRTPGLPLAAWGGLCLSAAGLVALLVQFWGTNPEYADRFLVLIASACIVYKLRATAPRSRPLLWLAFPLAGSAALLSPFATYLHTQAAGGRTVLLWLDASILALGAVALLLGEGGWRRARHFAFPILFAFFALPLPSRILGPLQHQLQEATTAIAAAVLPLIGLPVERSGVILHLRAGDLGVAEACSGVQSLTALTALAAFVAHRKGFGPMRGTCLTLFAVPVVVVVNALRVILSGAIQDASGRKYILGEWHDALGFALIFVGLGAVVGVARLVQPPPREAATLRPESALPCRASIPVEIVLLAGMFAGVGGYFFGSSREVAVAHDAPLDSLPMEIDGWRGADRPVPEEITALLGQDRILHRSYENNLGQRVSVWVIYWSSAKLVKGYHHPDLCWGNRGFRVTAKRTEDVRPSGCGAVPATVREFERGGRDTQFVLYWTQEGNRIWTDADERAARAETGFFTQPDWLGDALSGKPAQPAGRLVVLVGTESAAPLAQAESLRFTRALAAEVYRICPWAKPEAE
jgi:EpsI family protein